MRAAPRRSASNEKNPEWKSEAKKYVRAPIKLFETVHLPGGVNAITLLIVLGVTTVDNIAPIVGMTAPELAGVWNELPLDDLTIAERLGVTRQQVINLRKAARERLARRMAARAKGTKRT